MRNKKSINLDSKVLNRKLKEIDERIDNLFSDQQKWAQDRHKSIYKLNKINREINSIESNIHFSPLQVKIEDLKKLYHLYNEQKKYEKDFNSIEKKLFDLSVRIDKQTKTRINLLLPTELLSDIENRVKRIYSLEKNIDEDLRKDPILFKIVSEINSDIVDMNRHNINLDRRQVARCILDKFKTYKKLMTSTPYPIKITKRNYFEAVAPKVNIVQNNGWHAIQLYNDAIRRHS